MDPPSYATRVDGLTHPPDLRHDELSHTPVLRVDGPSTHPTYVLMGSFTHTTLVMMGRRNIVFIIICIYHFNVWPKGKVCSVLQLLWKHNVLVYYFMCISLFQMSFEVIT